MPLMAFSPMPARGSEMSISDGSFFGSKVNDIESGFASPPSLTKHFPSLVNVMVEPGGGGSFLPPCTADSGTHSPRIDGGSFFGASFAAGAATNTAMLSINDVCMASFRRNHFSAPVRFKIISQIPDLAGDSNFVGRSAPNL